MRLSITSFLLAAAASLVMGQEKEKLVINYQSQMEKLVISYQSQMGGVTHFIARDKGYYEHMGLDVEFKWYPSGAPQVKEAVEDKAWDIGEAGVVPNIIGGPQGIIGIAISQDQSATNQLVGNAEGAALWPPASMEGIPIVLSPNSTGDFVVQACLKSQGFNIEDVEFIYAQQSGCLEALTSGDNGTSADLGGLWAPNTYTLLNLVEGAETLCSGASVYATVTGGQMARREFAEEKPETVAKFLSAWLRAIDFINNDENQEEVLDYMAAFYEEHDVDIPRPSLELDLRLVGLFGLEEQLDLMERRGSPPTSNYDIWTNEVANFMLTNGVISELVSPTTYIDDSYMQMVNADPVMKSYATGEEVMEQAAAPSSAPGVGRGGFALAGAVVGGLLAIAM